MNRPPKDCLNTVDADNDKIFAEMPLEERFRTANSDEDGLLALQLGLGKYLRHLIRNQSEDLNTELFEDCIKHSGPLTLNRTEAASYIL